MPSRQLGQRLLRRCQTGLNFRCNSHRIDIDRRKQQWRGYGRVVLVCVVHLF